MAQAAKDLTLILLDCTSLAAHKDLKSKYGVMGFPTVVYIDSSGKQVGVMQEREPQSVAASFKDLAQKHTRRPDWKESLAAAIDEGKREKKPVLLVVAEPAKPASAIFEGYLVQDETVDTVREFALARIEFDKASEVCKTLKLKDGVIAFVLDPMAEDPLAKPLLKVKPTETPKKFAKELEKGAKEFQKSVKKSGAEPAEPASGGKSEAEDE